VFGINEDGTSSCYSILKYFPYFYATPVNDSSENFSGIFDRKIMNLINSMLRGQVHAAKMNFDGAENVPELLIAAYEECTDPNGHSNETKQRLRVTCSSLA